LFEIVPVKCFYSKQLYYSFTHKFDFGLQNQNGVLSVFPILVCEDQDEHKPDNRLNILFFCGLFFIG